MTTIIILVIVVGFASGPAMVYVSEDLFGAQPAPFLEEAQKQPQHTPQTEPIDEETPRELP